MKFYRYYYFYLNLNKMNEDLRKKNSNLINTMQALKSVSSTNYLSKKLSDGISKQKENEKLINVEKKIKQTTPVDEYEDKGRKMSNMLNFKALTKHHDKNDKTQKIQKKINKEKKQKQVSINHPQQILRILPQSQPKQIVKISEGISINVNINNIHNLIPTKKSEPSERSLIKEQQKKKEKPQKVIVKNNKRKKKTIAPIKSQYSTIEDFECQQILDIQPIKSNRHDRQQPKDNKDNNINNINKNFNLQYKSEKNFENQIKEFEMEEININILTQNEELNFLIDRETFYFIDPCYIQRKQKHFSWIMRAILMEWMMHVNTQYCMKRQTYHISMVLTDLYFNKISNIQKCDLQLVGAASMYIASKLQQQQPLSVIKFVNSTSGKYSANAILQMETKICKILKWNLNPPTINMWANKIMLQWDLFIQMNDLAKNHPIFKQKDYIFFKKSDQKSYQNFRQVMQLIDCCMLDIQTFQYKSKLLVCSFLYLVLGKQFQFFSLKQITTEFPCSSLYMLNQDKPFNDIYKHFVHYTFGIYLFELLPIVQYCATYFILPLSYECPDLKQIQQNKNLNFEQFSSYQTYNSNHLVAIKKRYRGIYVA